MPNLDVVLSPAIALIAGILILLMPRLLNYVIAIYLIAIGVLGLMHHSNSLAATLGAGEGSRKALRRPKGTAGTGSADGL